MSALKHNLPYAYRSTRVPFTMPAMAGVAEVGKLAKCEFWDTKYERWDTHAEFKCEF